jgi:hypothetical protein
VLDLAKYGKGFILGDFFPETSGHPDQIQIAGMFQRPIAGRSQVPGVEL